MNKTLKDGTVMAFEITGVGHERDGHGQGTLFLTKVLMAGFFISIFGKINSNSVNLIVENG